MFLRKALPTLPIIVALLLLATGLRTLELTRLPPGLNADEIADLTITRAMQQGEIASLYRVRGASADTGREPLYPLLQAPLRLMLGDGLLNLRLLSVWCGVISLALVFALGRRLFGNFAGLVAAAVLALGVWPVLLSRSAMREALLLPLICAALWAFARAIHLRHTVEPDPPNTRSYTTLGVLTAGLAYTHWTGLLMFPFIIAVLAVFILTRQPISRRVMGASAFAFVIAVILGIPYLTYTLRDFPLSGFSTLWESRPESVGGLLTSTLNALLAIGVHGDSLPQHNVGAEPLLGLAALAFGVMGLVVAIDRRLAPNTLYVLLALLFGLLPSMWSRGPVDFTSMVIALPALALLVGVGVQWAAQTFLSAEAPLRDLRVAALSILLLVISTAFTANTVFERWAAQPGIVAAYHGYLGRLAAYLDRADDGRTTAVCTFNLYATPPAFSDPALLRLMMHRQSDALRFSDCLTGMVLTGGGTAQRIAFADPSAASAVSPVLKDWLTSATPVSVDGLPPNTVIEINVENQLADAVGILTLAHARWNEDAESIIPTATLPVRMGYNLTFEGYLIVPERSFRRGEIITLITYWRVDGPQQPDLQVFAHLSREPQADPIQQNDILSVEATSLQDRDILIQIIPFAPLPPNFPPGEYYVSVGAYRRDSRERFPVYDQDTPRGDRLFLDRIVVQP